jgi:hypothetical protein
MTINISSLSASERKKLADHIVSMSPAEQKELVELLGTIQATNAKDEGEKSRKQAFAAKLSAMKADKNVGASNAIAMIEGDLRRGGCPPLAELGTKSAHEISSILAASSLNVNARMATKNLLHRLGAID